MHLQVISFKIIKCYICIEKMHEPVTLCLNDWFWSTNKDIKVGDFVIPNSAF